MVGVPNPKPSPIPNRKSTRWPTWGPVAQAIRELKQGESLQFQRGEHYSILDLSFKRGLYAIAERIDAKIRVSKMREPVSGDVIGWELWRVDYGGVGKSRSRADHS